MKKLNDGRGRYDLLPPAGIARVAMRCEIGSKKYGDHNWKQGIPVEVFINSALRHLVQYLQGDTDEDHLAASAWNLLAAMSVDFANKKVEEKRHDRTKPSRKTAQPRANRPNRSVNKPTR